MRRGLPALVVAVGLATAMAPVAAAAPASDAERLLEGLPPGFRRPTVVILPLLDQRALTVEAQQGTTATAPPPPAAWTAFIEQLAGRDNLEVLRPEEAVRRLTADDAYRVLLESARNLAYIGYQDHREVRLKEARDRLGRAIRTFRKIAHHVVDPREVARAELTRGLAFLEDGRDGPAYSAFQEALLIDPSLRLRPGFDRKETIQHFEAARRNLLGRASLAPIEFVQPLPADGLPGLPRDAIVVRGRTVPGRGEGPDRLEITYWVGGGLQKDVQPLGADPDEDGGRLASRVWTCLPFGTAPRRPRHRRALYLDAGFAYFAFLQAPVEVFSNFGAAAHVSWVFAPNFTLDGNIALTNGNRDRQADLQADVATLRGSIGPGYTASWGRLRGFATIGFEFASPSEVRLTTNPACKHFPLDQVPEAICDPADEIERVGRSIHIGGSLTLGGSLRLVEQLYLTARVNAAEYFFETHDNGLGRPVGVEIGLGWRF